MEDTTPTRDEKQERFIELRAQSVSYDNIAKQLKISKPTLISWSKKLHIDIHNLREIQRESLRDQFAISKQHRIKMLSEQLKKARDELVNRDYSDVPTLQLLNLVMKIENRIAQEEVDTIVFLEEYSDLFVLDNTKTDTWNG